MVVWPARAQSKDGSKLTLLDRKVVLYRPLNDWRALTAELLSKATTSKVCGPAEIINQTVKDVVSDVMEVVTPWHTAGDSDALKASEGKLCRIIHDAVQFSRFLRRQRALWNIRFASRPKLPNMNETGLLMFDPAFMKDNRGGDEELSVDLLKQRYVGIVVMPALYKRGTMNGELFDSEEAVVPAIIIMERG